MDDIIAVYGATGILVRDQIEKFGANLYTAFFKPSIPARLFIDKEGPING